MKIIQWNWIINQLVYKILKSVLLDYSKNNKQGKNVFFNWEAAN